MAGVDLSVAGLASGMDWKTLVSELASAERAPEIQWQTEQSAINAKNSAFTIIKSYLNNLQSDVTTLKDPTLYSAATAQSSDSTLAIASADNGSAPGSYVFNISQLATAAKITGTGDVGQVISPTGNLSAVTVGSAPFATPVTGGTFTVDGQQITIATTDSLQQVFDNIAAATNNNITASYNSATDKITLTSADGSPIVLGSAADTSNFLQVAQLYNNGSSAVTSAGALGVVSLGATISSSNLKTQVVGDASGNGSFTINGVSISYNVNTDSLQDVLERINSSAAGVTVSYNVQNDQFTLVNKTTGDVGIALQDNAGGNFLAATGLANGAQTRGQNLLYTLNGGTQLVSQSNTIGASSSGVTGLSVTALNTGSVTVTVASDTSRIKTAIENFIKDYNSVQSYITTQSATSTDSSGKVTAGPLTGDRDASDIASSLRSVSFSPVAVSGLPSSLNQLADLGIQTNGQDNTITLSDSSALDNALANNLDSVKALFSDSTNGLAVQLDSYLTDTIGDSGTLTQHQTSLTQQSSSIDTQIANLEKTITADSNRWTAEFQAMEQAQAQINQQLTYLTSQMKNWGG